MLQLKKIKKDYYVADTTVEALKGIDITFRDNEFVSVLGPSGCGKTTLLNIIGGLDHYTSGDLIIDGKSTKKYNDRDWDTYRNHRIGFIFQSYNLIPHQTVLENVELALNIAGVEKSERVRRAKEALDRVGLENQYNKRPSQLSGGQCQRVAIARALVGNPEILLADEPTGALDTVTSVQIMELIREIAKERLVIMVTHNPELAEQYSTRIVRLLDGNVIDDTDPYEVFDGNKEKHEKKPEKSSKKAAKLAFWSAFKLSARNLRSKFKRTLLVCLAGSIGIIGVATVLSVSTGIQGYIYGMQDDMLSGNPISIEETALNISGMTAMRDNMLVGNAIKNSVQDGYINVDYLIDFLLKRSEEAASLMVENDITREYLEYVKAMPSEYYSAITEEYGIDVSNNIYTGFDFEGAENGMLSLSAAETIYTAMLMNTEYNGFSVFLSTLTDAFSQMPNNADFILSQYEFVTPKESSKIPSAANEIMIVIDDEYELTDLVLAQLGYYGQSEFLNIMYKSAESPDHDEALDKDRFSYEELIGKKFVWYPNNTVYNKADAASPFAASQPFTYNYRAESDWDGVELTITAILKPKDDISYGCLQSGMYYTDAFAKMVLEDSVESEIVEYLSSIGQEAFNSTSIQTPNGMVSNVGITYTYSYELQGTRYENVTGFVGSTSAASIMSSLMGGMGGTGGGTGDGAGSAVSKVPTYYTLTARELGGVDLPEKIKIYPTNFDYKDSVTDYLTKWNRDGEITVNGVTLSKEDRSEIVYTDNLSLVIGLINNLINIVTYALVAFTALSLVVSTVMISIITYVSVIERVKEIGVIRSLGGRKKDVSRLFNAETFIIGGLAGLIGIGVTYALSALINSIVGMLSGITTIATLTPATAIVMVLISISLTLISGLVPAKLAAKKDPADALRSE